MSDDIRMPADFEVKKILTHDHIKVIHVGNMIIVSGNGWYEIKHVTGPYHVYRDFERDTVRLYMLTRDGTHVFDYSHTERLSSRFEEGRHVFPVGPYREGTMHNNRFMNWKGDDFVDEDVKRIMFCNKCVNIITVSNRLFRITPHDVTEMEMPGELAPTEMDSEFMYTADMTKYRHLGDDGWQDNYDSVPGDTPVGNGYMRSQFPNRSLVKVFASTNGDYFGCRKAGDEWVFFIESIPRV